MNQHASSGRKAPRYRYHTNEIHNTIRNAQRTRSLHATTNILHLGAKILPIHALDLRKIRLRKPRKARHNILAHKLLCIRHGALLRDLHLQLARAESKIQNLFHARFRAVAWEMRVVLRDLVAAGDAQVYATFADEGGDVGCGEEDQGDGEVLDEGDVEAGFAAELDVAAGEEVESGLLETTLWKDRKRKC